MDRIVIGVFDHVSEAQRAVDRLAGLGIDRQRIHLRTADDKPGVAGGDHATPRREVLDGIRSLLVEIFGPDLSGDDPRRYTQALEAGQAVVAVEVRSESELDKARQSLQLSGANRTAGTRGPAPDGGGATPEANGAIHRCIEACRACHKTCLHVAMTRCLELGGKYVEPDHFRLLLNCAEICHTTANFLISRSQLYPLLCGACAEVCAACARRCEALGDMDACVQACRDCGEACRRVAEAAA